MLYVEFCLVVKLWLLLGSYYFADVLKIVMLWKNKCFLFSAFTIFIEAKITNKIIFPHFAFTLAPPYAIQNIKFAWPYLSKVVCLPMLKRIIYLWSYLHLLFIISFFILQSFDISKYCCCQQVKIGQIFLG